MKYDVERESYMFILSTGNELSCLLQDKMTQQVGRAMSTSRNRSSLTKGNKRGTEGRERHNLVLDLGNVTEKTITDMQRAFVQVYINVYIPQVSPSGREKWRHSIVSLEGQC